MGGLEDLRIVKLILYAFEGLIGLATNFGKTCLLSCIIRRLPSEETAAILNCSSGLLPVTYLGIPISSRRPRKQDWKVSLRKCLVGFQLRKYNICH